MFTKDTLSDKTILITGGGSGLGLAMAKGFAESGANIAICGRTEEKLQKAVKEIEETAENAKARYYICDVRDHETVTNMVKEIVSDFGSMEGLVNNAAGIFYPLQKILLQAGSKPSLI